jgi:cytochrome c oxidase subunit 2
MTMAVVLILLVVGSVLFHYLSPWYFTPIASNWTAIDDTVHLTFWVTGFVFVTVNLFLAYCVWRYRHGKTARAHYEPENKKLEGGLIVVTTVGVVAMLAPGLFAWAKFIEVPKDAAVFEVVGRQWNFNYRFPGEDGVLGTVDARFISDANPFGINPGDPHGRDDILVASPVVHLPIGKATKAELRSIDVLHDFTVPQFRAKMNMAPGLVTYVWFTPTRTGTFDAFCEQLCGIAHYSMRGTVIVEEESAFRAWQSGFPTFAQTLAQVAGDPAAGAPLFAVCAACHGAQGEGNPALNAPKLSGQQDWYLKRQLQHFKSGARGAHEKDVYGKMMAPMAATLTDDTAINNVVAYMKTLPDTPAPVTVKGNAKDGHGRYENCAACHGADGLGIQATNAPRLKGMSDWYMVTQLNNFKHGIRGADRKDSYGPQMATIAAMLDDERTTADLVAYINTFK